MIIFLIYKFIENKINKNVLRYLKVYLNKKVIITIIIVSCVSNYYIKYKELENQEIYNLPEDIEIEGIIESNAEEKEYYYVYNIKVTKIKEETNRNVNFLLYVKKNTNKTTLSYGDLINAKCTYIQPNVQRNYKGFDYKQYLKTKDIYGILKTAKVNIIDKECTNKIFLFAHDVRNSITERLSKLLSKENSGLLTKMLVGIDTGIDEETNENFRESNLSHLLAVSGSHVAYIILGVNYLLYFLSMPKRIKYIITIFLIIFFMILSTGSASVTRACIMGMLFMGSKIVYKKSDFLTNISLSLLIILIINPYSIFDIRITIIFCRNNWNSNI